MLFIILLKIFSFSAIFSVVVIPYSITLGALPLQGLKLLVLNHRWQLR